MLVLISLVLCTVNVYGQLEGYWYDFRHVNDEVSISPYPFANTSPSAIGIKGRVLEVMEIQYDAQKRFGEFERTSEGTVTVYKYENNKLVFGLGYELLYNQQGQLEKAVKNYNEYILYSYSNGKLQKVEEFKGTELQRMWRIFYQGNNKRIERYNWEGKLLFTYIYNNNLLSRIIDSTISNMTMTDTYIYNSAKKLIRINKEASNSTIVEHQYVYNSYGWVSKYIKYNKVDYQYIYPSIDSKGNWTKRIRDDYWVKITERIITYAQ